MAIQLQVNANVFRTQLPTNSMYKNHGAFQNAICDEFGRQYVIAMNNDEREFSERALVTSQGNAVEQAFFYQYQQLVSIFGYNTHTALLYVQLWEARSDYAWGSDPVSNADRMGALRGVIPVQPNFGTFSLDVSWVFRNGLTIAVSGTAPTFTTAGTKLVFTAFLKVREPTTYTGV